MPRSALVVLPISLLLLLVTARADEPAGYEKTLQAAGLKTDDQALLGFFRERTLSEADRAKLAALVRQLGAEEFADRNRASEALTAAGRRAVPFLKAALKDRDLEISRRAQDCLREIEAKPETPLVLAALGLVAARKPAGAAEALLAYAPYLEEEDPERALFEALLAVAVRAGKLEPALVSAIKGKHVRQRTAAAWVLGRLPKAEDRERVVPLLADPESMVRLRAAEALVVNRDRRGLGVLVALLEKAPVEQAQEAESLLTTLAREKAPAVLLGPAAEERKKCHQAWLVWWRVYGAKLDLAKLDLEQRVLGLRLVAVNSGYGGYGATWEYGPERKKRWMVRNVGGPFDVRVLPGDRLLIAEYDRHRVTERDRNGKILWEYTPPHAPLEVQRLPNGNTFIVTNSEILEVTRAKAVAFIFRERRGNLFAGQKLANGHILYGVYSGSVVELDRAGKEVNRFPIERPRGVVNIEVLPGGKYLIPLANSGRIIEVDRKGKVLREVSIPSPTTVAVLPDGNLLVGSYILNNVREIDRAGKVLWEQKTEGQVFRVRVR